MEAIKNIMSDKTWKKQKNLAKEKLGHIGEDCKIIS